MDFPLVVVLCVAITPALCRQDLKTYEEHECKRSCVVNEHKNCSYDFKVELYYTLSKACYDCPFNKADCHLPHCVATDGVPRGVIVVNRMLPGPGIHVCEGDTVIVNVFNDLKDGEGVSIHWHGMLQNGSQHMDGVSMVTQCPINIKSSFEYRFIAGNAGTHFWHAHSGMQRSDGVFGPLVVRQAPQYEVHHGFYDEDLTEHTVLINDWTGTMAVEKYAHYNHADGDDEAESMLINGKGAYRKHTDRIGKWGHITVATPVEVFSVKQGKRYRFRSISAASMNCPIQISIDDHSLNMIATDGAPFEKTEVQSYIIYPGERFDFVVNSSMPVKNYWIRFRGLADCGEKLTSQVAILRYEGAPNEYPQGSTTWEDAHRTGKILNPLNKKADEMNILVSDLKSLVGVNNPVLKQVADKTFYLAMDFNIVDNYYFQHKEYYPLGSVENKWHTYMPQLNRISFTMPKSPPLYQLGDLDEDTFCNMESLGSRNCSVEFCECIHRLQVQIGDVVEFVIIAESINVKANHPMHLHGYRYYVMGMGLVGTTTTLEDVKQLDEAGSLPRNLVDPVGKDTVTVPDGGYTIIRFHATNPGFWFFHCHIKFHLAIGMALLVQVGEADEMPKVPQNFAKCGDWTYTEVKEQEPNICVPVFGNSPMSAVPFTTLLFLCAAVSLKIHMRVI